MRRWRWRTRTCRQRWARLALCHRGRMLFPWPFPARRGCAASLTLTSAPGLGGFLLPHPPIRALLLPPFLELRRLTALPPRRERGAGAKRTRERRRHPQLAHGHGGEWRSPRKRRMCEGHCPPCVSRLAQRGGRAGGAYGHPFPFHRTPFVREWEPNSVRLPFAHDPCSKGGVSTTPCVVPRARPLRAPPFGHHPTHAVPHAGQHAHGTRKMGCAGVVHAGRHGVVLTRNGGRGMASVRRPPLLVSPSLS